MAEEPFNWKSFWDLATPEEAAGTLAEWYGAKAAEMAARSGLTARADRRNEDYRFWIAVFARLRAGGRTRGVSPAQKPANLARQPGADTAHETLELVRAFHKIRCPALRSMLLALIRDLGDRLRATS